MPADRLPICRVCIHANLSDGMDLTIRGADCDRHRASANETGVKPGISRSTAAGWRATIAAPFEAVGLDLETLARIELNASIADGWLAPDERAIVAAAESPVVELACRWVLKEAYGKALGVGLALPLAALAFGGHGRSIMLAGPDAPDPRDGWRFGLYRHDDMIVGVAYHRIRR